MHNFQEKRMFWATFTYFIILLLFTTLRLLNALGLLNFLPDDIADYAFTVLTQIFILFLVPMCIYTFIFKQKPQHTFRNFLFRKISIKSVGYSILLGVIVFFIITFASSFFSTWLDVFGYEPHVGYATGEKTYANFGEFLLGILFVAVLPGFFEEFSNRGMLLSGMQKGSTLRAVLMSGLLFGLMHLNINQFFYATVSGIIMATVAIATKSIWPSIIIHFMNNAINTYLTYASENGLFGTQVYDLINLSMFNSFVVAKFLIYLIFIALVIIACVWLVYKLYEQRKKSQIHQLKTELSNISNPQTQINMDNYADLAETYQTIIKHNINPAQLIPDFYNIAMPNGNAEQSPPPPRNITLIDKTKLFFALIFPKKKNYKPTFAENFFLYSAIILGSVITIFTFIWGLL